MANDLGGDVTRFTTRLDKVLAQEAKTSFLNINDEFRRSVILTGNQTSPTRPCHLPPVCLQSNGRSIGRRRKGGRMARRDVRAMLIDFNTMDKMALPGMNGGTGTMTARMFNDERYRIMPTAIHPGGSIGEHVQESGDDLNYVLSGIGLATCDGAEELLRTGVMHICPQGSTHSIRNTGGEDLVLLTVVVKR